MNPAFAQITKETLVNKLSTLRMLLACAIALGTGALVSTGVAAQDYPSQPIRMVVPYGPGGVTDITARQVTQFMAQELGQTIIVDNRPGGSSMIGTEAVVKAKPDGYTLLLNSGAAIAANPSLFKKMPYDASKDLVFISQLATVPYVIVVPASSPVNTLQEFIALGRAKSGSFNYSSAGNGSGNHLAAELFMRAAGFSALHIPYKSGGEMVGAVVGNQVTFTIAALPSASSFIKAGTVKALAVTSAQRNDGLPNVPTVAEAGVPNFTVTEWLGIFGPAGLPSHVIDRVNAAANKVLRNPELIEKLRNVGAQATGSTPAELERKYKSDVAMWAKLTQEAKIEAQ